MAKQEDIWFLREVLAKSRRTVFFGGAGVSTESGVPDFRSQDGLYNQNYKYPPEEILSHHFFLQNPEEFYTFYREKMLALNVLPNAAHRKLAQWEQEGKISAVITQNIDGLHQKAGSKNVLELHGSIWRNYCMRCGKFYSAQDLAGMAGVPHCSCGGVIKPDVVLYEESLSEEVLEKSVDELRRADLLIVGGTSLNVYPAAGLIDFFGGNRLVVVNRGATARRVENAYCIDAKIGELFSAL